MVRGITTQCEAIPWPKGSFRSTRGQRRGEEKSEALQRWRKGTHLHSRQLSAHARA